MENENENEGENENEMLHEENDFVNEKHCEMVIRNEP